MRQLRHENILGSLLEETVDFWFFTGGLNPSLLVESLVCDLPFNLTYTLLLLLFHKLGAVTMNASCRCGCVYTGEILNPDTKAVPPASW